MTPIEPTLLFETNLFREGFSRIGALDEVGTGSAAGPCCSGLVVISQQRGNPPAGLRDSKLLSAAQRDALVTPIHEWVLSYAVGYASAIEIDQFGLTTALRLAGHRALSELEFQPDVILLDGNRDWLSLPDQPALMAPDYPNVVVPPVRTLVKADMKCASVAAASVLAKVERDAFMVDLARRYPDYQWQTNKGYATTAHLAAIGRLGRTSEHRRSWNLSIAFVGD